MPMRVVSAWAFLQMKTWGLHFMKISGWLYLFLWVGYTMAMSLDFPERMANSEFGMGWWLFNLFYLSPMSCCHTFTPSTSANGTGESFSFATRYEHCSVGAALAPEWLVPDRLVARIFAR